MKNVQNKKLLMYVEIQEVCRQNNLAWNKLKAFSDTYDEFEEKVQAIFNALQKQYASLKGVSESKEQAEEMMADKALQVAGAVFAYAADTQNLILKERVNFNRDDLTHGRNTNILERCRCIYDEAVKVIFGLENYGIRRKDLNVLKEKMDEYAAVLDVSAIASRAKEDEPFNLVQLFEQADVLLKEKLDKLTEQFRHSNPYFYNSYFDARAMKFINNHQPRQAQKATASQ